MLCHTRLTLSKQYLHWRCHHYYILNFVLIYIFVIKELRHKILFGRLKTFIIHIFFILFVYILRQYFFIDFFFNFCLNSIDGLKFLDNRFLLYNLHFFSRKSSGHALRIESISNYNYKTRSGRIRKYNEIWINEVCGVLVKFETNSCKIIRL